MSLRSGLVVGILRITKGSGGALGGFATMLADVLGQVPLLQPLVDRPPAAARQWIRTVGATNLKEAGRDWKTGARWSQTSVLPRIDLTVEQDADSAAGTWHIVVRNTRAGDTPELDRVARNEHYPPEVSELATLAAGLTRAWCGLALGDPGALELLGGLAARHPEYPEGRLRPRRWYCPAHLTAALSPQVRERLKSAPEAAGPAAFPELSSFPAPKDPDPLTILVAWPPAEVVARQLERAYEAWRAAQPGDGTGEAAGPRPGVTVRT